MTKADLETLHNQLVETYNRRLTLGNYNADCSDILDMISILIAIVHHLKVKAK